MRPAPTQTAWPSPQSCSPSTLMRRSTRSLMALASSEASLCVVNEAHSGFWPAPSVFRYEIKYFGIAESAPMRRPLHGRHQIGESTEEVVRVVRAWRGFRVVLHAEDRQLAVVESLTRGVVQVQVGRLPATRSHRGGIDREVVVLGGDLDAPGGEVAHGVVGPVVAERQLVGTTAGGEADDLVSEADAEDHRLAEQPAYRLDEIGHALGIA